MEGAGFEAAPAEPTDLQSAPLGWVPCVLDHLTDSHNAGSVLRSVAVFGAAQGGPSANRAEAEAPTTLVRRRIGTRHLCSRAT